MTKEEYKNTLADIHKKERELKEQRQSIEAAYLEEHLTVFPGDKVKVFQEGWNGGIKEHTAYISYSWVTIDGEINHVFIKVKKDGEPSTYRLHLYGKKCTVELIDSSKRLPK